MGTLQYSPGSRLPSGPRRLCHDGCYVGLTIKEALDDLFIPMRNMYLALLYTNYGEYTKAAKCSSQILD